MNYEHAMLTATVVQDILLLASAALLGWYLYETRLMRVAAEEQLEAQIRPAIAVQARNPPESLLLVNVGKGPALNLTLSPAERGAEGSRECAEREIFDVAITLIAESAQGVSGIRTQAHPGLAGVPVLNGRSLQCQYTSLSGRTYWTVVDFDHASGNTVESTRFNIERRAVLASQLR